MELWKTGPQRSMVLVKGKGCKVWDDTGKEYLDLQSGYWCNVLGYGDQEFVEPMREQIDRLTNVMSAFKTKEIYEALSELEKILPIELCRASFLNSGSEAVDLALKMARAATGKSGVVVNDRGYYGGTSYTFALSGSGKTADYLPNPGEVHRIAAPICHDCEHGSREACNKWRCLSKLEELVKDRNDNIAAIIYEPVLGGGKYVPPIGSGGKLREYADKLGALLISNEVTVSPAKSGRWFAFQHDSIVPDILTLGKAIGGGFPVSVTITTSKVEEMCKGSLYHVQSHQNDALSGRAILTVLRYISKHGLVEQVAEKGDYFIKMFSRLQNEFSFIVDVRGRGLILGVQLSEIIAEKGEEIQWDLIDKGYLMDFHKSSSSFRFFPPFVISYEDIDDFIEAFRETLSDYH